MKNMEASPAATCDLRRWITTLYEETESLWAEIGNHVPLIRESAYEIFYSLPRKCSTLMIIGENPGGDWKKSKFETPVRNGSLRRILEGTLPHNYFAVEGTKDDYDTARMMRLLFQTHLNAQEVLRNSVKLNLNFFRSSTRKQWEKDVPLEFSNRVLAFCRSKVLDIISTLAPRVILTEGWRAHDFLEKSFGPPIRSHQHHRKMRHQRLVKVSTYESYSLAGIVHVAARPRVALCIPSQASSNELVSIASAIEPLFGIESKNRQ